MSPNLRSVVAQCRRSFGSRRSFCSGNNNIDWSKVDFEPPSWNRRMRTTMTSNLKYWAAFGYCLVGVWEIAGIARFYIGSNIRPEEFRERWKQHQLEQAKLKAERKDQKKKKDFGKL